MDKLLRAIEYAYFRPENLDDLFDTLEDVCVELGRPDVGWKARQLGSLESMPIYEQAHQEGYNEGHSAGKEEAEDAAESEVQGESSDDDLEYTADDLAAVRKEAYEAGMAAKGDGPNGASPKPEAPRGTSLVEQRFGKKAQPKPSAT